MVSWTSEPPNWVLQVRRDLVEEVGRSAEFLWPIRLFATTDEVKVAIKVHSQKEESVEPIDATAVTRAAIHK